MASLGEKRVRVEFINLINGAAPNPQWDDETLKEWLRLKALGMTAAEEATIWSGKMSTI